MDEVYTVVVLVAMLEGRSANIRGREREEKLDAQRGHFVEFGAANR